MSVSMSEESYTYHGEASAGYHFSKYSSSVCEIEEESPSETFEINHGVPMASIREEFEAGSLFSVDAQNSEDSVYVGVGKSDSSMDALAWTLKHAVTPSTIVYLVHVFPEIRCIPSPLGKLPKNQVSPEQVETYMAQERGKRGQLLQKFVDACSTSKVKVDTILIESDMVASAIRDLIPILNIRTLVVGTTKSSLRKLRSKRGSGRVADKLMLQNAAEGCVVKIICDGKEVTEDQMIESPSPRSNDINPKPTQDQEDQRNDTFSYFWDGIKTVADVGMLIHVNAGTPPLVISMVSSSKIE